MEVDILSITNLVAMVLVITIPITITIFYIKTRRSKKLQTEMPTMPDIENPKSDTPNALLPWMRPEELTKSTESTTETPEDPKEKSSTMLERTLVKLINEGKMKTMFKGETEMFGKNWKVTIRSPKPVNETTTKEEEEEEKREDEEQ